jgi:Zn-dependent M28 family amino/carboxypeptidase
VSLLSAALLAGCGAERPFDEERAFADLVAQVEAGPRVPGTPAHAKVQGTIRAHLDATAERVTVHPFRAVSPLDSSSVELVNLVGVFNAASTTRILFGAHWDSRLMADEETDPAKRTLPVPGANDGASGVAVLLEIARALAERPPEVGVDLAFFDGEDQGVHGTPESWALGSQRFVQDFPTYRPTFVVVIDMIGRRGTRIPREGNSARYAATLLARVWAIGEEMGVTVLADSLGTPVYDDHVPFLQAGIPAIDLIDPEDPRWHTTADLPEHCAPESLRDVGRLLLGIVRDAERGLSP